MLKSYKYRIYPNESQQRQMSKTFGSCRYVYNWALNLKNKRYQEFKQNVNRFELSSMLTFMKTTNELEWLNDVNSQSIQASLRHLDVAFTNFFRKTFKYPNFKRRNQKQSFECPQNVKINFETKKIQIPKIGKVKYKDIQTFDGQIKTCSVSKNTSGQYFISILVDNSIELPLKKEITESTSIGIDVGISTFCTLSTGEKVENPKWFNASAKKLAIYQKRFSKKVLKSKNRNEQRIKVAKIYNDITNKRKDFINKLTTKIIKNHDTIFVEDLNITNMMQTKSLAKSIQSASWGEFFRQLEYKSAWYGKNLIKIGRFEPSSKMCSCGKINSNLQLSDRNWVCTSCGELHDRDILASNNIKKFGLIKLNYNTRQVMSEESVDASHWRAVEAETFVP